MGMDKCIGVGLICFYLVLTLSFTALYCIFYYNIYSDPGYAEISVN